MFAVVFIVILSLITTQIKADISPQSNCLFHNDRGLFVLLDLKAEDPYLVTTPEKETVFFNLCDTFPLPQCNFIENYYGYVVTDSPKRCFPLTSVHSGKFESHYGYEESVGQNVLNIIYEKDPMDQKGFHLHLRIICSQEQLQIGEGSVMGSEVRVTMKSVHGCPAYQTPPLLQLIEQYELLLTAFALFIGFLFLFYGRVMTNITAYFSMSTIMLITLTFLCFRFMEQNVDDLYLYLTLIIVLLSSFAIPYFTVKYFIQVSLFFVGALFGFFAGTFIKAFILAYIADQAQILFLANSILNFLIVAIMLQLGTLTLEHKQYVIIYSSSVTGSYLIIRGVSLLIGGFPCEFQLLDLIEAKQITSIPLSFFIYLILVLLLAALGGIYQQLKLQKERKSGTTYFSEGSSVSRRLSGYIEGSLDQIHDRIERIIDRYRNSEIKNIDKDHMNEDSRSQQMDFYQKLKNNEYNRK